VSNGRGKRRESVTGDHSQCAIEGIRQSMDSPMPAARWSPANRSMMNAEGAAIHEIRPPEDVSRNRVR
jgi:hypothetical protein